MSSFWNSAKVKGNAQFLFLCNPEKSSVNIYFIKIIKKDCHKKINCVLL